METIKKIALYSCILSSSLLFAQEKPKGKEWKVPEASAKMKSAIKADDASIKAGKEIWAQNCKSCHGVKGLGDGAKAEKIDISCGDFSSNEFQSLSDGALFYKTTEGRKPMPSFKDILSDTERWQVVCYMRTLKKAGSATSTSSSTAPTTKITKEEVNKKPETLTAKKDSISDSASKKVINEKKETTDSVKVWRPEYIHLKEEIEILKQDVNSLKIEVEALKQAKSVK